MRARAPSAPTGALLLLLYLPIQPLELLHHEILEFLIVNFELYVLRGQPLDPFSEAITQVLNPTTRCFLIPDDK
jgi:hypothetical protein